jgi:uncharacterized membrane protein YgcG
VQTALFWQAAAIAIATRSSAAPRNTMSQRNNANDANAQYPMSASFGVPAAGASASRRAAPPADLWPVHGMTYRIPPLYDQLHLMAEDTPSGFATYTQWARSQRVPAAQQSTTPPGQSQPAASAGAVDGASPAPEKQPARGRGRPPATGAGRVGANAKERAAAAAAASLAPGGKAGAGKAGDGKASDSSGGGGGDGSGGGGGGGGGSGAGGGSSRGPTPEPGAGEGEGDERGHVERWRRAWSIVVRRDILRQQRAIVTQQRCAGRDSA